MKTRSLLILGLLKLSVSVQATTLGLSDPLGNPVSSGEVGYALWDSFTDADPLTPLTFAGTAPGSADSDLFSATLSANMTGGSATGSGDRLYNGVGASSAAFNLTLNGSVAASIDTITIQIKMTKPDVATGLVRETFFSTATLNGIAGTAALTNAGTGELFSGNEMGVISYTWSGLDLNSGESFAFLLQSPASGHVSVDAIQVDASAVPEPTVAALAGLGLAAALFRERFSRTSKTQRKSAGE